MPCFAIQTLQNHDKASGEEGRRSKMRTVVCKRIAGYFLKFIFYGISFFFMRVERTGNFQEILFQWEVEIDCSPSLV